MLKPTVSNRLPLVGCLRGSFVWRVLLHFERKWLLYRLNRFNIPFEAEVTVNKQCNVRLNQKNVLQTLRLEKTIIQNS